MSTMPPEFCYVVQNAGIDVDDAAEAFRIATAHGAVAVQPPTPLRDESTGGQQVVAEVLLYGDVVLRFVSGKDFKVGFRF